MKLRLDDLDVQSFEVSPGPDLRGTVVGKGDSEPGYCTNDPIGCEQYYTVQTCPATCAFNCPTDTCPVQTWEGMAGCATGGPMNSCQGATNCGFCQFPSNAYSCLGCGPEDHG